MVMVATPPSGRRPSRTRRTGTGLLCALILSGCSYSYLDQNGARHVVGLVDMTIAASGDRSSYAGDVVDISGIGVAFSAAPDGWNFSVGYTRETFAGLRDNAMIVDNPLAVRSYLSRRNDPSSQQERVP